MDFFQRIICFSFLIFVLSAIPVFSRYFFSPIDNYLIDCGSAVDSVVDNRNFVSDSSSSNSLVSFPKHSVSLRNGHALFNSPQIYKSARVFRRPSRYEFEIRDKGTHMVRLHFLSFSSSKIDLTEGRFNVLVNGYVVLSNFTCGSIVNPLIKEFLIWVSDEKLAITFIPEKKSRFAFVSAIEVISAPEDLIADTAKYLSSPKVETWEGLTKVAMEVVHRVTVGGPKVTPFNDTLWRTWIPDDEYFKSSEISKKVYTSGRIMYQNGGASRLLGPDNVYNTARVIESTNSSVPKVNMTWVFPVTEGYQYMVRLHFCDIASISVGLQIFDVYVNGYLAFKDLDLSRLMNWVLSAPFYADFVVDGDSSGVLSVSIGPSKWSQPHALDGTLNGVEIMKLNNSLGSLDGELSAEMVMKSWPRERSGFLVPLVVFVCLLVSLSLVLRKMMFRSRESITWSQLPVDQSEVNLKLGK